MSYLYLCFCSKLLYELYKAIQQEVDEDVDEAQDLAKTSSILKLLIQKACQTCNIPGVIVSPRLMQAFKTKIWRLNETMAKVKTQGGNGVRNLLNKWTTGRYSTWSFKIYYS